jgi:hypothetical protein
MSDLPNSSEPETPVETTPENAEGDDQGAALERAAESIDDAREAEGRVTANDDITTADEARAGEHSQSPDGEGGRP